MEKLLKITCALIAAATVFSSCKKENVAIDKDPIVEKAAAKFKTTLATDSISSYFIKSTEDPFKLVVGVTTVSDKDRTIGFTYTSRTAVAGQQYTAPATITIPAGKSEDTLRIKGIYAGYTGTRIDTLLITINESGDIKPGYGFTSPNKYQYRLVMRKYCDVVLSAMTGDYTRTFDATTTTAYPQYTAKILSITPTGATTATAVIRNVWEVGGTTNVTLDWTDPSNFKTSIPAQFLYTDPQYGAATITGVGNGTFNSCENTITLSYKVTVAAGSFGNFTTKMVR